MLKTSNISGSQIANTIIIPMVVIVFVSVVSIFGLMHWSARISDESARDSEANLLSGALQLTSNYMVKQQVGVAVWDEAYRRVHAAELDTYWLYNNVTHWLFQNHGFTKSVLIDRDYQPEFIYAQNHTDRWMNEDLLNQMRPAIAKVRARYINTFRKTPSGLYSFVPHTSNSGHSIAETGVLSLAGEPYLFSAAAVMQQIQTVISERRPPAVLVSMVPLRGERLAEISEMTGLAGFVIANRQIDRPGIGQYQLTNPRGDTIGVVAWNANRPGSQLLQRINPYLVVAASMIAAVVIAVAFFTRHMTRRLAKSEQQAIHTARHDALSGLPNRSHFHRLLSDTLEQGTENGTETAVVYIDLDHFKDINDTLGHSAGDKVIAAIAGRLHSVVPDGSLVARISGDEFAMLIRNCVDDEWLDHILDKVQDEIAQPIKIGSRELHASLSMGAAVSPRDGTDPDDLLRRADIALYDAKENGRNRRSFFEPTMEDHVQSKDKLSRELRLAMKFDELDLAYQPQSDTYAKSIVSVEALARWTKPDGTVVPPSQFIPVAEETGLINDLGLWILNKACAKAHEWPSLSMSVNVSPNQFKHPRFVEKVMAILAANNLPPQRLEIEVTETVFAGRNDTVLKSLRRLKNLGVKVALDDFGSGYSSLSYLRRFPFDTLKIDKDFVSDMNGNAEAEAILVSIIQLGKALGMTIVAEGIETIEQIRFLQAHSCHRMQGYFISKPLNEAALRKFLEDFERTDGPDGPDYYYEAKIAKA
ncbi:bifunctional diguanylate cyclase/phosphodiesterase [Roseibium denhamense]|uniref:Periplasmic sensor diguanylate cyclase/phosphodiesterase n=1 Tax=Roseibium denhamense TaxID=76305 RepID=A0ABY1N5Q9_9HYPH|nr:EAL domain-containing protein [Roseibium denhamense]MTI04386.1 bifunctional diguanylate cyclase/phosphodiesterase [Roseibium denhamense]SMP00665.1 periplasmic sensor diguanylate cyclase/phosphodiesterase [Roseibium denhamense]